MKDMKYIVKENKKMLTVHVCIVRKICRNSCCCRISVQQKTNTAESCYYGFEVMFSDLLIVNQTTYMLALNQAVSLF